MEYNFKQTEKKWQDIWDEKGTFCAGNDYSKPKFYALVEFPYPSGQGLHVGHPRSYTALDIVCRKKRLQGYNVLYPMGWDAFGLPTENFAIKNHIHPSVVTEKNVAHFKEQLKSLGFSFDWSREIDTTDPNYYKWTQWIFLQFFKAGLAYKKEMAVNWCPSCKCVLANEEAAGGHCERCGSEVVRKVKSQWMLKITEYAEKLLNGLDEVNFIERVKTQQRNWIGRSHGAQVKFSTTAGDILEVYTTRPDTLFGATYMVMAPEHALIEKWQDKLQNMAEIRAYQENAARKSDFERTEVVKEKTGVRLDGVCAINPVNGKEIPIFISDYVLASYGTGAIMAVPAHDERDYDFAKVFGLPIIEVVAGGDIEKEAFVDCDTGVMVNSGFLNGLSVEEAKVEITRFLTEKGLGEKKVNYKLRDWVFSRQRYWGEPIPIVHCPHCGTVPLPEDQLPLVLPDVDSYEPTETGESPLAKMTSWVNTTCPVCGAPAQRETDTMPQWAGSSWYFLRYVDPHNNDALASREAMEYWN
ncbi:MAG: leucine--tRNA ligase, partial [Clostridia bacterium]|nr:leucine--tRNA ligase [Clostridia bacterium]